MVPSPSSSLCHRRSTKQPRPIDLVVLASRDLKAKVVAVREQDGLAGRSVGGDGAGVLAIEVGEVTVLFFHSAFPSLIRQTDRAAPRPGYDRRTAGRALIASSSRPRQSS